MYRLIRHFVRAIALSMLIAGNAVYANPGNSADNDGVGAPQRWQKEWYLRLTVESTQEKLRDRGNVLGQLRDSIDGLDSHDLIELAPFSSPFLTLVFVHPDWIEPGNYSSDYHNPDYRGSDMWDFQVHSDLGSRDINLYWDQIVLVERKEKNSARYSTYSGQGGRGQPRKDYAARLYERMRLEDVDTGEVIRAVIDGDTQSYSFNMSGSTIRSFRWVLDDVKTYRQGIRQKRKQARKAARLKQQAKRSARQTSTQSVSTQGQGSVK